MGNLLRNVRDMGRKIGRSMLKMNAREKERKRKANRYFGEEPDIMPRKREEASEDITGGSFDEEVFPDEDEAFFHEDNDEEEGFF